MTRSKYMSQFARAALLKLADAYAADIARKLEGMSDDARDAWQARETEFMLRWAEDIEERGERGIEYEMMLDMQLITRRAGYKRK